MNFKHPKQIERQETAGAGAGAPKEFIDGNTAFARGLAAGYRAPR